MPCHLAGSAIAQGPNVGLIDTWSDWNPDSIKTKWLLLSGASDPPDNIAISDRRTRDTHGVKGGTFRSAVAHDLANMEAAVGAKLFKTVKDICLTNSAATGHIRKLFDTCKCDRVKPILYYTGHGEIGTGNWCFANGTISIQGILNMSPEGTHYPMIFSDACYSGHWANFCLKKNIPGFHCLAACPEYSKAVDTKGEGGDLTLFITGKLPRPRTEPIYSRRNRNDFPITTGYDSVEYTDFIGSHLLSSEDILISQSFHNGCFSGIFAASKMYTPRPAVSWEIRSDYDSFFELVNENWNRMNRQSKQIYSLACDEKLGFGVLFLANYGVDQTILTNTSDIGKKEKDGFQITACAARGSTFYIVMTKDTREYQGKQAWFTLNSWDEAKNVIQENQDKGRVVTGICYSTGQRKYLVVVMETTQDQIYRKFRRVTDLDNWVKEQYKEGFHPTIIFKDPADTKTLVVMIKDGNRSCYTCKYDCKVVR